MECQQIPPFPTGSSFVETVENGSKGIHPCIRSFDTISEGEKFGVQKVFLIILGMVVEVHIGNDSHALALSSEIVAVKSGIGIKEKSIGGNACQNAQKSAKTANKKRPRKEAFRIIY